MKRLIPNLIIAALTVVLSVGSLSAQNSPDKFINYIKKGDTAVALTIPGWVIKWVGNIAVKDIEDEETAIIKEMVNHIKKLRFVVSEDLPDDFEKRFSGLKQHLEKKGYEPLLQVREEGTHVDLWAEFDDDIIKRMVIAVLEDDESSAFFNIKSNIDLERLKNMNFYKEWEEL